VRSYWQTHTAHTPHNVRRVRAVQTVRPVMSGGAYVYFRGMGVMAGRAQQRYWTDLWDTLLELEMSNERNGSQCREPTMKSK
jgi:hypothetical protein